MQFVSIWLVIRSKREIEHNLRNPSLNGLLLLKNQKSDLGEQWEEVHLLFFFSGQSNLQDSA